MRIFQRLPDQHWWLDYVDLGGVRHRKKTDTTSKRKAEDLLSEVRSTKKRRQLGLEVAPISKVKTVGEAWKMWLDRWCPAGSKKWEQRRYDSNIKGSWLAELELAEVGGEALDKWFAEKAKKQAASTVNGHRRILRCVYNTLVRKRLFRGMNPVKETRPLEEAEYAYEILSEDEFRRVLPHVDPAWQDIFVVAFTTGLRRGEIYGLRKDRTVVDLERATLTPRASNQRALTKGKRVKSIPLMPEPLEVIRRAWNQAEWGELLFPARTGKMRGEHLRPGEVLRSAMVRAGLVEGWEHVCRRGCKGVERHRDEQQRRCRGCNVILWPKPIVRRVRFHDLRHSVAAYLLDRGVDLADVQQLLRHSTIGITEKHYRHRTVEALRKAITVTPAGSLGRHLEALADGQPPEVAKLLNEAKVALARHQPSNVVSLPRTQR